MKILLRVLIGVLLVLAFGLVGAAIWVSPIIGGFSLAGHFAATAGLLVISAAILCAVIPD